MRPARLRLAAFEQALRRFHEVLERPHCFRIAFRLGLIDKDARWIAMVEDRNRTTHAYDAETARKVYGAHPARAAHRLGAQAHGRGRPVVGTLEPATGSS